MDVSVFSWPGHLKGEIAVLKGLFQAGLGTFHFRKQDWSYSDCHHYLTYFSDLEVKKIILHQHFELRQKFPVKGIHFSSYQPVAKNREVFQDQSLLFSTSIHRLNQFVTLERGFSMVYISPIFDSISKSNHFGNFDGEDIKSFLDTTPNSIDFYALGGIDINKIKTLKTMGFDGAGLLGSIWENFNNNGYKKTLAYFKALLDACKSNDYEQRS